MKIVSHIVFFYLEARLEYLNRTINEMNSYEKVCDIYIHSNTDNFYEKLPKYTNGHIKIIFHNLTNIHPFYLTWKPRAIMKDQANNYDIFIYLEDDILIPNAAIKYWLRYKDKVLSENYNLGFFRIETNDKGEEYCTDQGSSPDYSIDEYLSKIVFIKDEKYIINNINPYSAFWIYDKNEFKRFIESQYYNIENIRGYGIREASAIGLHGLETPWYKNTVIPLVENQLISTCKVYHLPNNYIDKLGGWHLRPFNNACKL